jgi:hypothetical protein
MAVENRVETRQDFIPIDVATNKGLKNGGALRSGKLAFDAVIGVSLSQGLAPPLHLRGGDFWFRLDGKIVHKQLPFLYGKLRLVSGLHSVTSFKIMPVSVAIQTWFSSGPAMIALCATAR